jgi:hypothetical protein
VPLQYRDITDLANASQEDIDYNIDLANKKRAFTEFSQAERSDDNGKRIDGKYHRYNDEFIEARNKFEVWINNDTYGQWYKRNRVDEVEYAKYEAKYYNFVEYNRALRGAGNEPTGVVIKREAGRFVKAEYKEINQFTLDENGNAESTGDMRSEKYKAIFDPNKTDALSIAQKEFYVGDFVPTFHSQNDGMRMSVFCFVALAESETPDLLAFSSIRHSSVSVNIR